MQEIISGAPDWIRTSMCRFRRSVPLRSSHWSVLMRERESNPSLLFRFDPERGCQCSARPGRLWTGLQNRRDGFDSRSRIQNAPVARAERHRSSKSADARSNPVWSSTDFFLHGRVAQWMSADLLHRRMHVRIVSRSPNWIVNWAGAQRRLLSDRPACR